LRAFLYRWLLQGKQSSLALLSVLVILYFSERTVEKAIREQVKYTGNKDAAAVVGKLVAERALAKGVKDVAFDRSGFKYHGRVQTLADAAREAGLQF